MSIQEVNLYRNCIFCGKNGHLRDDCPHRFSESSQQTDSCCLKEHDNDCPICLKPFKENNFVITKCNHKFCLPCFMDNYNSNDNGHKCSLCREKVVKKKKKPLLYSNGTIIFESSSLLFKIFRDDEQENYPLFKELLELIQNKNINDQLKLSYFKDILGTWINTEFIITLANNLKITKQ